MVDNNYWDQKYFVSEYWADNYWAELQDLMNVRCPKAVARIDTLATDTGVAALSASGIVDTLTASATIEGPAGEAFIISVDTAAIVGQVSTTAPGCSS